MTLRSLGLIHLSLFTGLSLLPARASAEYALAVGITTAAKPGAPNAVIPIRFTSEAALTLLRFSLVFDPRLCAQLVDPGVISVRKAGRNPQDPEEEHIACDTGEIRIAIVRNLQGSDAIPAGSGAILEIRLGALKADAAGTFPLALQRVVADKGSRSVPVAASAGQLVIRAPLTCGNGAVDRGEQCDDANTVAGDGCSPQCFLEPPATAEHIPGRGNPLTECAVEWMMDRPSHDASGNGDSRQRCRNSDATCDRGVGADECLFHVWLCVNNHDPRLPLCQPGEQTLGAPLSIDVLKPSARDAIKQPEDATNRSQLLSAASAVTAPTLDGCGPRMALRVPLRGPGRRGNKRFKVRVRTTRNWLDVDALKLFCLP